MGAGRGWAPRGIVDASVVVKWFAVEPLHDEARALLTGSDPLLAPDILAVEVANALWVKIGRGELELPLVTADERFVDAAQAIAAGRVRLFGA